jgi:uncharacterized sulfatase
MMHMERLKNRKSPMNPSMNKEPTEPSQVNPNILFIMCDELRFPTVFPSGISTAEEWFAKFMPNVYSLWQKGVKFTSHYTAGNACTPARGTLLTGLYSLQTYFCETLTQKNEDKGSRGFQPALNPAFPTWGKLLREQGYRTVWAGKWHASYADGLKRYGWDEQPVTPDPTGYNLQGTYGDEKDGYRNDQDIEDAATGWLKQRKQGDQPWALTASFVNPHDQQSFWAGTEFKTYNDLFDDQSTYTPITYYSMNEGKDYPPVVPWVIDAVKNPPSYGYPELPPNWESAAQMAENKPSTQLLWRTFGGATWGAASDDSDETEFSLASYPNQPSNSSTNTGIGYAPFSYWQRGLDAYTWFCEQVDKHVGNVVSALPEELEDNTIIVFTADHGEFAGAHGMLAGKIGTNYEEAFHIPLIVVDNTGRYATDIGTPRTGFTSSVDMLPFLVSLPSGGRGWMTGDLKTLYGHRADMLAMLKSADAPGRPYVVFNNNEGIPRYYNANDRPLHITGLRTAKWKLGSYARWLPGTTTVEPGSVELEYYDYSTTSGQQELDSTPDTPAAAAANNFLQSDVIPNELQAPLPASLVPAQKEAQQKLIDYFTLLAAAEYPPDPKSLGFGQDF